MNHDIVFIELGLSDPRPRHGEILSIAACRIDRKGNVIAAFAEKVAPAIGHATIDAPDWFNAPDWTDAQSFDAVWKALRNLVIPQKLGKYRVVARNSYLTRRMLVDEIGKEPFGNHDWLDIGHLAWPLWQNDMIPDDSFDELCVHFGIDIPTVDQGAESNCTALVQVYSRLMSRYKAALLGEEAVRDYGGKVISGVRQWFGI